MVLVDCYYTHYKGGLYKVLAIAKHTETEEDLVIYEKCEKPDGRKKKKIWARPLKMFEENVIVDGKEVPRFELTETWL